MNNKRKGFSVMTVIPHRAGLLAAASLLMFAGPGAAAGFEEIIVTATRVERDTLRTPLAVGAVGADDIQRTQQIALDESMNKIPGVFFQNRYNQAQDTRVSIRGFGGRAAFGIRGVKIFIDGIPATVTDGQTADARFDFGSVERIEVIRGPASALYGSASGGVISVTTEDGPETPFVEVGASFGEFEFNQYRLKAGGQAGQLNYLLSVSHTETDSFRRHADTEFQTVNAKLGYTFDDGSTLKIIGKVMNLPTAEDPGGLTAAQVAADRTANQFNNLRFNAGEDVDQQRLGFIYEKDFGEHHSIVLRNYYTWRGFDSRLPFGFPFGRQDGVVQFDRFFVGGGIQYSYTGDLFGRPNRLTIGVDADAQQDDRQRLVNTDGGIPGALTFDQMEKADSVGLFFQNELTVTETVDFILGGRYDMVNFEVEDRFLANGDQSDKLDFNEFNPMVGLVWSPMRALNLYANYSTSFETPTFGELANPALNGTAGGFASVGAQTADNFEIGAKGIVGSRLRYELALFQIDVEDEIIGTTCDNNRCFFDNADTERMGVEAGLGVKVFEGLDLDLSYTYSDFTFEDFPSLPAAEGRALPGIPEHQFFVALTWSHESGLYVKWDMLFVDKLFADNLNTASQNAYKVSSVRFGRDFRFGAVRVSPYFGINNLFDEEYNQSIRLNEFNSRFFEPAPDRNVYGGLSVRYDFDG